MELRTLFEAFVSADADGIAIFILCATVALIICYVRWCTDRKQRIAQRAEQDAFLKELSLGAEAFPPPYVLALRQDAERRTP